MIIQPLADKIQLKIEEAIAGVLDTSSRNSAVEYGEVIAVGENIKDIKAGDKVFFKSWAIDICNYQDKRYYFIDITSKGILAIVK